MHLFLQHIILVLANKSINQHYLVRESELRLANRTHQYAHNHVLYGLGIICVFKNKFKLTILIHTVLCMLGSAYLVLNSKVINFYWQHN